ncbi:MAG: hypothetical protein Q8S03_16230 [Brevundimonas sp.]|nr:hypothetical protein [Brevundimonas sp.]MDP3406238.1 hypothetical protein [Brevundimonas sp.]
MHFASQLVSIDEGGPGRTGTVLAREVAAPSGAPLTGIAARLPDVR